MIRLEGITKKLGNFKLDNLNLEIPSGYICGLVGQNGAGKTSLIHVLLGLYKLDEGHLTVYDKTYEDNRKELLDDIGVVLVEDIFDGLLSLEENAIRYGKYYLRYRKEKLDNYLNDFKLNAKKKFKDLSKGEKLKFQFAFALAHDPKLLILDEPTGNFDPSFREQFWNCIKDFMQDEEKTVLLATHLTEDLERIADYLVYLENGKQLFAGDMESFREEYRVVYGEKYKINLLPKENIIYIEETQLSTKAIIKHSNYNHYDTTLKVTYPTIEEVMYGYAKRG